MVGLKQSNGVIPHSQVADAFGNYTYVTPMTRTVMDTALMLQAMAGPHPSDPGRSAWPPQDYIAAARPRASLKGKRILFSVTLGNDVRRQGRARGLRSGAGQAEGPRRRAGRTARTTCPTWSRSGRSSTTRPGARASIHLLRREGQPAVAVAGPPGRHGGRVDRRGLPARHVPAHRSLPPHPGLVRDGRLSGDADALADGAAHRPGPVRADQHRRRRSGRAAGATGSPTPCRSTSPATPPSPCAAATTARACRSACRFVGRFRDEASVLRAAALYEASESWLDRWPDL